MNKTFRLFLACILLHVAAAANACWYATYSPMEYFTCRIPQIADNANESMVAKWQRSLLLDVSTDEISKLLFAENGYTVEEIRKLKVSPALKKRLTANGNELLEYVCTMREVNEQREKMSNPWYFYYVGEPQSAKLNKLANTCLKRLNTRYGDRYAVVAARALNTLKRYSELESLAGNHKFKDKEVEAIFRPEYAGVLYKMSRYDEAAEIYAKAGDQISLKWCLQKLGQYQNRLSVIARLADYESNYNTVVNELSTYIHYLEDQRYYGVEDDESSFNFPIAVGNLIETSHVRSAIGDKYQPLWRYAEAMAYLIDNNDFAKADSVLALINTKKVDAEFGKSIRTLRFITQSRLMPYNANYLAWVASEAEWLMRQSDAERLKWKGTDSSDNDSYDDGSVEYEYVDDYGEADVTYDDDYDEEEGWSAAEGIMFNRNTHFSMLYYSDMLHKAVDVIIAPRMLEHGDTVAALQLLDIVDYANLSDADMREYDTHGNASACFVMEYGADVVVDALARSKNPRTPLDRLWKKTGSIRDADRWLDFAGTALLAEGRYKEAAKYFRQVSGDYAKSRNIGEIKGKMRNPFAAELRGNADCRDKNVLMTAPRYYKLWFAEEMAKLEDVINNKSLSADRRAEATLKYGVGMANSVYPCWSLTTYGDGESVYFPWTNESDDSTKISNRNLAHRLFTSYYDVVYLYVDPFARSTRRLNDLRETGEKHIADALGSIKNRETIAAYLKSVGQYKTIKHHYADTAIGKEMHSKCDNWKMY